MKRLHVTKKIFIVVIFDTAKRKHDILWGPQNLSSLILFPKKIGYGFFGSCGSLSTGTVTNS